MTRFAVVLLVATSIVSLMTGCGRRKLQEPASAGVHYVLGPPWRGDGCWFYPRDEGSYVATGLAVVDGPRQGSSSRTADGETYDPASLTASHQTLQLPVVLRVRNLENGRVVTLRVNDRGPASPGRLLSVTPASARLLGMIPRHATRIQITEDTSLSETVLHSVRNAPAGDLIAAPVAAVQEQSLTSPGTSKSPGKAAPLPLYQPEAPPTELTLGGLVQGSADPGRLWIDAGHFSQRVYARQLASSLAGTLRQEGHGRSASFSIWLGPFDLVTQADAALDRARSGGVTDARITVE